MPRVLKPFALFDFDDTLIRGDSIVKLCFYAVRKGWMNPLRLLPVGVHSALYLCGLSTPQKAKQAALRFLKGRSEDEVNRFAEDFCRTVLIPRLYPDGVKELKARAESGCEVWLVSASPEFYLKPLMKHLPLSCVVGTRLYVEDGRHTGLMAGENCRGVEKPLRIAEMLAARGDMLDYAGSWAYGDTAGDAPMLMQCGHKMAVNARKKLIKALEGQDGVEQVRFR